METVAKHLEAEALRRTPANETDLFGRTAFNRYYYATFWIVRNAVAQIDPKWSEPSHGDLPDLLEGKFIKRFRIELKKAEALGTPITKLKIRANSSASALASLMRNAYYLRIQADYKPDAHVIKDGAVILLNDTKSSIAAEWPRKAKTLTADLLNVAKQINLI